MTELARTDISSPAGRPWRVVLPLLAVLGLSACVLTTGSLVFEPSDFAEVEGLAGLWRQEQTSEGEEDKVLFRISDLGGGRYRALPLGAREADPAAETPEAGASTAVSEGEAETDEDEPVDFSMVGLGEGDFILVSPDQDETGGLAVLYLGARLSDGAFTTFMFGGGTKEQEAALTEALAANGLTADPSFSYEVRLKDPVSKEALRALFAQLLADPAKYGAYWVRYARAGD